MQRVCRGVVHVAPRPEPFVSGPTAATTRRAARNAARVQYLRARRSPVGARQDRSRGRSSLCDLRDSWRTDVTANSDRPIPRTRGGPLPSPQAGADRHRDAQLTLSTQPIAVHSIEPRVGQSRSAFAPGFVRTHSGGCGRDTGHPYQTPTATMRAQQPWRYAIHDSGP